MQNYLHITDELKKVSTEKKAFQNTYNIALTQLRSFNGRVSGVNDFYFSIEENVIEINFLDETYFIEFQFSRANSIPKGNLSLYTKDNLNRKFPITSQEFKKNGDIVSTNLSFNDEIETLAVVLNLVKVAIES